MININIPTLNTFNMPARKAAEKNMAANADAIDSYRNIGTYLIKMEAEKADVHPEVSGAVIGLFRRLVELMDASAILMREGSIVPVQPLIRIMLELGFQFEFLLIDPAKREEKAFCMFLAELNETLVNAKKLLTIPNIAKVQPLADIQAQIDSMQAKIDNVRFDFIRAQYDNVTAKKDSAGTLTGERRASSWFTIADPTIKSIAELNINLDREKFQSLVYSELSNFVHSSSLMQDTLYTVDGVPAIRPLRAIDEEGDITSFIQDARDLTNAILKVATFMFDLMYKRQSPDERIQFIHGRGEFAKKYKAYWHAVYISYLT